MQVNVLKVDKLSVLEVEEVVVTKRTHARARHITTTTREKRRGSGFLHQLLLAGDASEGKGEQALVLAQQLAEGTVVGDHGGNDTHGTSGGVDVVFASEFGDGEEEESDPEAEEEGDEADVLFE